MLKNKFLLIILVLAAVLRLYGLSAFPAGLNADEAALGYNAYSLMTTGRDEHGHLWPVNLESFGDFKPALYAYVLIPFIKIFGLNEFAVRLPSALAGIISVYLLYLIVSHLTLPAPLSLIKERGGGEVGKGWALISALMLAISPWHLQFSRGAWEVNLASTLILAGIYNLIIYFKNHNFKNLVSCILFLVSSLYTYQSARIFVPIFGLLILIVYRKQFVLKHLIKALPLVLLIIPVYYSLFTGSSSRFSGVGFTADIGPVNRINELRGQHSQGFEIPLSKLLHNKPLIYVIQFADNYLSHFDGNFLFINGDVIQRNKVPETGQFYLIDIVFLVIGLVVLIRSQNYLTRLIWMWLFTAPLASSLTFQVPHALRAQLMLYPLIIIISLGVMSIFEFIKSLKIGYWLLFGYWGLVIGVYSHLFLNYLHNYYIHYPQTYPAAWEYGFREMIAYVNSVQNRYEKIVITDKYDQPYILYLFFSQYPPAKFQTEHVLTPRDRFNFSTVTNFSKFQFTSASWEKVRDWHGTLIVAAPEDIPEVGVNIVKTVYFPNGLPAFKIVSN